MRNPLKDFLNLVFPESCVHCGIELSQAEKFYCFQCEMTAGFNQDYTLHTNPMTEVLYGRIPVTVAHFLFYFYRHTVVQSILHELKYRNNPELARYLGRIHGRLLKDNGQYRPDKNSIIIPVPLHKSKLRKRGYNQAEEYARGLSDVLKLPVNTTALVRRKYAETLTRRGRLLRWITLREAYRLERADEIAGKHCILADDICTTGATLERCYQELTRAHISSVSVFTIAFASRI
ncbi:MAG: ComF family protein [Thermaurantimonas sp.]